MFVVVQIATNDLSAPQELSRHVISGNSHSLTRWPEKSPIVSITPRNIIQTLDQPPSYSQWLQHAGMLRFICNRDAALY